MKTALLVIDIQNDYFPGGKFPLVNPEAAAKKAYELLQCFREHGQYHVHVQHVAARPGAILRQALEDLPDSPEIVDEAGRLAPPGLVVRRAQERRGDAQQVPVRAVPCVRRGPVYIFRETAHRLVPAPR